MEEIDYYRTQSGLLDPNLSQADYEYEYFKNASGLPADLAIDDYKTAFYAGITGYPGLVDAEYWYFAQEVSDLSGTKSLEDLKRIFFSMQ